MREDIDFKGADRESDFWLIYSVIAAVKLTVLDGVMPSSSNIQHGSYKINDVSTMADYYRSI